MWQHCLPLFEIARVLVRFDRVASFIGTAHNRRVKEWEIIADKSQQSQLQLRLRISD